MPDIYVASLSDYVADILHGVHIDAALDVEDIHAEIQRMLANSPTARSEGSTAEEWAIHDYNGFGDLNLSEHEPLEIVHAMAEAIEDYGPAFVAWAEYCGDHAHALESFGDARMGEYDSPAAWAEDYLEGTGALQSVPADLRDHIDFDSYAREAGMGDIVFCEHNGTTYVFDGSA